MKFLSLASGGIFAIKEFRQFVLARLFLTLAIQIQFTTVSLQVYYEYSKEELLLGMIGLAEAVPFIVTSFFSGYSADRYSRKKIILAGIFSLFLGALFLYMNSAANIRFLRSFGIFALFGIIFFFGIIRSFLAASMHPYMSQIIPRQLYTHSATWNSTAWHVGAILGPVIAGIIYGTNGSYHADKCHITALVLFFLSFCCIATIKHSGLPERPEIKENMIESMRVGLKFVFGNKLLLSALSLDLFAVLFGGAVAMLPSFNDKVLHLGPQAFGWLRTAPAIGAVFMALIMMYRPPSKKAGKSLLWSVAAFGAFTIVFGLSKNFWLAFGALFMAGAFDNVSVVVRHSIMQLSTPDNMRGRVSAINSIFIGSSNELGAAESGITASWFGLIPSIVLGGVMTIGVVFGVHRLYKPLSKLDLNKLQ